ncbi:unnamed protein product [Citrullus colocynthis]|uniref:Uncharacterized protein n=1 Tax=Citrullus colocynthis TaxID=252529 RepID=A0ABP0XR30_9ROSI
MAGISVGQKRKADYKAPEPQRRSQQSNRMKCTHDQKGTFEGPNSTDWRETRDKALNHSNSFKYRISLKLCSNLTFNSSIRCHRATNFTRRYELSSDERQPDDDLGRTRSQER